MDEIPQLSVAVAAKLKVASHCPASRLYGLAGVGHVIIGD